MWRPARNSWELLFFFYHVGPLVQLGSLGLPANTFISPTKKIQNYHETTKSRSMSHQPHGCWEVILGTHLEQFLPCSGVCTHTGLFVCFRSSVCVHSCVCLVVCACMHVHMYVRVYSALCAEVRDWHSLKLLPSWPGWPTMNSRAACPWAWSFPHHWDCISTTLCLAFMGVLGISAPHAYMASTLPAEPPLQPWHYKKVTLHSPGWPWTCAPPASASRVLG